MAKMPFMKFYPQDYLYDTRILTPEERGVWMDLICFLWNSPERGKLTGHPQHLAQMVGLEWNQFNVIIRSLKDKKILNLTESNQNLTIVSRRMKREEKHWESNRFKQKTWYEKHHPNRNLTDKKSDTKKSEVIKDSPIPPKGGGPAFEAFWKNYPKKVGKGAAEKSWRNVNQSLLPEIIKSLQWQNKSFDWTKEGGRYIPNPATWLNQRRWEDEPNSTSGVRRSRTIFDKIMDSTNGKVREDPPMGGLPEL